MDKDTRLTIPFYVKKDSQNQFYTLSVARYSIGLRDILFKDVNLISFFSRGEGRNLLWCTILRRT